MSLLFVSKSSVCNSINNNLIKDLFMHMPRYKFQIIILKTVEVAATQTLQCHV